MRKRQEAFPTLGRDIAWKVQLRLRARYRHMLARGKKASIVISAIAREFVGFIWEVAHQVAPNQAAA